MAQSVLGVHMVGSIRLPDEPEDPQSEPPSASKVFQTISEALPNRLARIPDGETGVRHYYVRWQDHVFAASPWLLHFFGQEVSQVPPPPDAASVDLKLRPTGYDEYAINSYSAFAELQKQGKIHPATRFQVSLPTPLAVLATHVRIEYQARVEPLYEELLLATIETIQRYIPPQKLSIQLDCAVEFAALEGFAGPTRPFPLYFEPSAQALVDRVERLTGHLHPETELGFHLCYGDVDHKHFMDPADASKLVDFANLVTERSAHPVAYIHLPVPKARKDEEYFAPLKRWKSQTQTELFLGLVHPHDLGGTEQRIEAAKKVLRRFGIATECGLGRTPAADIKSILEIMRTCSEPVLK